MNTSALRVFYRKSDNEIVWSRQAIDLKGRKPAPFSTTIADNLAELPEKPQLDAIGSVILDADENFIKLGGVPDDYACIEERDTKRTKEFLDSDENKVVDGKLIIGKLRIKQGLEKK